MEFPFGGAANIWADLRGGAALDPQKAEIRDWAGYVEDRLGSVDAVAAALVDNGILQARDDAQSAAAVSGQARDGAVTARAGSEAAQAVSQAARDAAIINSGAMYADLALGLAATLDGDFFTIPSPSVDGFADLYKNVTGAATYLDTVPNANLMKRKAAADVVRNLFDTSVKNTTSLGRPAAATLTTGIDNGNATYIVAEPVAHGGKITEFRCFALAAGSVKLRVFSRSGDTFTQVGADLVVTVAAGQNVVDLLAVDGPQVSAGHYIGYYGSGVTCATVGAADSGGWHGGAGDVSTFTSAVANTSYRLQLGFTVEEATAGRNQEELADQHILAMTEGPLAIRHVIGRKVAPVAGSGSASAGTYVMGDAATVGGSIRALRAYSAVGTTISVCVYERGGNDEFLRVSSVAAVLAAGVNVLSVANGDFDAIPIKAGQHVGFVCDGGTVSYTTGTADGAGWYYASTFNPDSLVGNVTTTGFRVEVGFDLYSRPARRSGVLPVEWDWNHVIGYGQSNSVGATDGVVINDTPSAYHLTFDSGPKTAVTIAHGNNPASGTKPLAEDDVSPITGLSGSAYGDTGLWQFAAEFSRRRALSGGVATLFVSTAGFSGAGMVNVAAGSAWYQNLIYHVVKAKEFADAAGKTYGVSAVIFDHGETDQGYGTNITKDHYRYLIENLVVTFGNQVREITGQDLPPQWLFTTSPFKITVLDTPTDAVNELCQARPDCHLVSAGYRFEHRSDQLHLSAVGQCVKQAFYGRAAAELAAGRHVPSVQWLGATGSGSSVTVRAKSQTPLEKNYAIVGVVTQDGFAFSDDAGAKPISSVVLGASTFDAAVGAYVTDISITLSAAMAANPVLSYAKENIGAWPLITGGAAGNIFDTSIETVTVDGTAYSMAQAAPSVSLPVYVPE